MRRNMMFYYLYEIRNNINGKVYVGVHKTKVLDDGYMGSGKVVNASIKKNGVENFTKTILEHFDSAEAMYAREKEVVTEEFLSRDDTYNLRCGGFGGFDFINKNSEDFLLKNRLCRAKTNVVLQEKYGPNWKAVMAKMASDASHTKEIKEKRRETRLKNGTKSDASYMNTPKAKEKQRKTLVERSHQKGNKNSQFGTMWITDGLSNKKIKKTDSIPDGWNRGRLCLVTRAI
jgi:hypothetical protein